MSDKRENGYQNKHVGKLRNYINKLNDTINQTICEYRLSDQRYAYFLLAVAASAMAFVARITSESTWHWPMLFLGFSLLSWAVSFYYGCCYINTIHKMMETDIRDLKKLSNCIQIGRDYESYPHASSMGKEKVRLSQKKDKLYGHQFSLIAFGGICFIIWHIVGIIYRSLGY